MRCHPPFSTSVYEFPSCFSPPLKHFPGEKGGLKLYRDRSCCLVPLRRYRFSLKQTRIFSEHRVTKIALRQTLIKLDLWETFTFVQAILSMLGGRFWSPAEEASNNSCAHVFVLACVLCVC